MKRAKGQRLLNAEIDKRVIIKLDSSINADGVNGIMTYGEKNDYPQIIEKLINSSVTAKAVSRMYAKFLTGGGFIDENLNSVIIGRDARGKEIKLLRLVRQISNSISKFNGKY